MTVYCLKHGNILSDKYLEYINNNRYRTEMHFIYYNTTPPTIKKRSWQPFHQDFIDREVPYIIAAKAREAAEIASLDVPAVHDGVNVYKACSYCPFKSACLSLGTEREIEILNRFPKVGYDPLTFR